MSDKSERVTSKLREKGLISIKPYVDKNSSVGMGLQDIGMVIFPGSEHVDRMFYKMIGNKRQYVTGLNDLDPDVLKIEDEKEREAKVKEIRETVALVEEMVTGVKVDPKNNDFWGKITVLNPSNKDFFSEIVLKLNNDDMPLFVDDEFLVRDLVIYNSILAGGFYEVAPNLNKAKDQNKRWYLSVERDMEDIEISTKRVVNQATLALEQLIDKDNLEIIYTAKALCTDAAKYSVNSANINACYNILNDYIQGKKDEADSYKAATKFKQLCLLEPEEVLIRAMVRDAIALRMFKVTDQNIVIGETNKFVGATLEEVYNYFSNPLNQEDLNFILEKLKNRSWT